MIPGQRHAVQASGPVTGPRAGQIPAGPAEQAGASGRAGYAGHAGPAGLAEHEVRHALSRLAAASATARQCHEHYLDGSTPALDGLAGTVTRLTGAHPWALAGFGDPVWDGYRPDLDAPPPDGLRLGVLRVPGITGPPGLPAVARFAGHGHLLISEHGSGQTARSMLQAVTLRLATATQPGSVRFALADPVGEGRYLSAFLRLPAPLRAGPGVAATAAEIEALLTALTSHVVEVTQTRLTNVYDSVEAYNAGTTGATVPYQVLVLAGFPAGVSDRAAGLLARLARNGPQAGLYIAATVNPGQEIPRGFALADLADLATTVSPGPDGDLTWDDPDFGQAAIVPDLMPGAARANPWLDAVAARAGAVSRDVPFRRIAVPPAGRWAGSTTDGLDVQIGVDSKGEPQRFVLGTRGVHHGLVGGDVRMGKTNLLHVLISQLALRYPPEELELYLLDFKEVEFDAYLTERLPHARAITSRTDREFGLSMLRRFHDEIERRARLCREARVTDLPDYRRETRLPLPRALVVMDEFQVLFSEEDRLAREAGRLLADIAKRGAAFGLHLLLATQSPGGPLTTYLRPVYEQMALRIALGCTQPSVSQAILGEGNEAATKLTRAGDAIYNDRRGEGANPVMRIAALPTRDRLELIAGIRALGAGRDYPPPASFDPDTPADFAAHPVCTAFAARPRRWPAATGAAGTAEAGPIGAGTVQAWLGEAIEIKPPTAATFERYARSNLLIVGGEASGYGLLLATLLSAAVQCSPADVSFTIAEFARPSSPFRGFFDLAADLPHQVRIAGRREAGPALEELNADLDARLSGDGGPGVPGEPGGPAVPAQPERFFLVAGLHRWQELQAEGDYGRLSQTAADFIRLAAQGPDVGIHVVAWTDSYATADRALRRGGIAQFGLRSVLRVLSPAESDALLGVAAAATLDDDRALYRDTEWPADQVEKFKPYSLDSLRGFAAATFGSSA